MDYVTLYNSPIGILKLKANANSLVSIEYVDSPHLDIRSDEQLPKILLDTKKQLDEYFHKGLKLFTIPIQLNGTEFQNKCWSTLLNIPYGETISYQEQAKLIGNPLAVRAVANANHANKLPIVIPCHRVIGKNGKIRGYGGGIWRDEWLLKHEGVFL